MMKNLNGGEVLQTLMESFPTSTSGLLITLKKKDLVFFIEKRESDIGDDAFADNDDDDYFIWELVHPEHGILYWEDTQETFNQCFKLLG